MAAGAVSDTSTVTSLMKITRVESIVARIPYQHGGPLPMFGGKPRSTMDILLMRVDTDAGITGWGEAFGGPVLSATREIIDNLVGPLAVGHDPSAIGNVTEPIARKLQNFGRGGPVAFALSGLDIALWDIAGKTAGKPVHELLGGAKRKDLAAYASLLAYHDVDLVAKNAAEAVSKGYRFVKAHEYAYAEVEATRKAIGAAIPLMVDTNCPWTVSEAIDAARRFAPLDLHWLEEPVWPPENLPGLAAVRRNAPMPIAAGENARTLEDFRLAIEAEAVSVLQPSLGKMGGLSVARQVLALAQGTAIRVIPHCTYFGPAALATIHLISTFAEDTFLERFYCTLADSPFGEAVLAKQGRVEVPQAPGLGIDPDPVILRKLSA